MDPVTHTLVGATLAESGLKRRTALGTATLLIGANIPDVDLLSYFAGATTALWFRRGVTHGVLGLLILPLILAAAVLLWDRWVRRRGGRTPKRRVAGRQILFLAALATATHPLLDFLNTYGMRWFMPFSDRWYYGDTLFIVDPWVWAVLAGGIFLARQRERRGNPESHSSLRRSVGPPIISFGIVVAYVALMALSNIAARRIVATSLREAGFDPPTRIMTAPFPVNPFTRFVVVEDGEVYRFGSFTWLRSRQFALEEYVYDRGPTHYAASGATRGPNVRKFMSWARFPYFLVDERSDRYLVHIGDARYTLDPEGSWAGITVEVRK